MLARDHHHQYALASSFVSILETVSFSFKQTIIVKDVFHPKIVERTGVQNLWIFTRCIELTENLILFSLALERASKPKEPY
jgi:hypothetical protein